MIAQTGPAPAFDLELDETVRVDLLKEVLLRSGRARIRAWGMSMLPAVRPGDVLEVRADIADLRVGDIALFERDGRLFCHRIEAMFTDGTLRTRGDYLHSPDPPIEASAVIAKVSTATAPRPWVAAMLRAVARITERPVAWWYTRAS